MPHAVILGDGAFNPRKAPALAAAVGKGADLVIDTIRFDRADAELLVRFAASIGLLVTISSASVYADAAGLSLDEACRVCISSTAARLWRRDIPIEAIMRRRMRQWSIGL